MVWFFRGAQYPFLKYKRWAYISSIALTVITLGSIALHGGLRYSIDFTGGTLVQLEFDGPVESQALRDALDTMEGLRDAEVQRFGEETDVVIRAQVPPGEEEAFGRRIEAHLRQAPELGERTFQVVRTEAVGPKIGDELKRQAVLAILYALGLIFLYVAFRFDLKFAVAAIIATFHDIVLSVGVFSLANKEISLAVVAAFLTIVGYSLNDTIVVFDRIREDVKAMRKESYEQVVNTALNETLTRTINTGVTTLFVLLILFFVGGETIRDFAFALIIGIVIGTYSSLFVGAPLVVEWQKRFGDKKKGPSSSGSRARS